MIIIPVLAVAGLSLAAGCEIGGNGSSDGDGGDADGSAEAGAEMDGGTADTDGGDAGGGGPDSGEGPAGDAGEGEENCGTSPFRASTRKVNVLLVIDKSGSMDEKPQGFDKKKWAAMKSSLKAALEEVGDDISLGLELFPVPDGCEMPSGTKMDVPVEPGTESVPKILDRLAEVDPGGGTPTAVALKRARNYFVKGAGAELKGDNFILLATDGGPNCNGDISCTAAECTQNIDGLCPNVVDNCCDSSEAGPGAEEGCLDDEETRAQIEKLAEAGITTFVVGIPGSEEYADSLDDLAEAGGGENPDAPPSYFAVEASGGAEGLTEVLGSITRKLITSCKLQLESTPPNLDKLNVEVDGELIPQGGKDGWELDSSTDPPTIIIKGKTCEQIEASGAESVTVVYGCPTLIIE
jgi:hypothetical protein